MAQRILNADQISQSDSFWNPVANFDCFFQRIGALTNTPLAANETTSTISGIASLDFNGSAISLVGYVWNLNENTQPELFITVDNGTEASQGTLKSGYYLWYQSPSLADQFHAIEFRVELGNTSFSTVAFDHAIVNITAADPLPDLERDTAIFDDTDPHIIYSGSWQSGDDSAGVYRYQNTSHWTNITDAAFSINFTGVGISIIAAVDPGQQGNYSVEYYIDSSAVFVVDVSWPPDDFSGIDLSAEAGGILTIVADATVPGNHTLQMKLRVASTSGNLPFALDYVVVTESLPSDDSWYHPNLDIVILVPVIWAAANIVSLILFRARITKFMRGWRARHRSFKMSGSNVPQHKKSLQPTPADVDSVDLDPMLPQLGSGSNIHLIPLPPKTLPNENDPLIQPGTPVGNLPSGLANAYYDKGDLEALYTPYALWLSFAFGIILIFSGIAVRIISSRGIVGGATDILELANRPPYDEAKREGWVAVSMTSMQRTIFGLCITAILTLINGFISGPRATVLKWALAQEGRLEFNSTSNFFVAAAGLLSSTGTMATAVYALATVFTFASAGFITIPFDMRDGIEGSANRHLLFSNSYYVIFHYFPLVITGLCIAVQALLTLVSYREYPIPTWSSQPFDVAAAAFSAGLVKRNEGRCLADVGAPTSSDPLPMRPSRKHPRLADVRSALTLLPPAGILLGTTVIALQFSFTLDPNHILSVASSADLLSASIAFTNGGAALAFLAAFQAPLTVYFHALDVAERVTTDEMVWGSAATKAGFHPKSGLKGLRPSGRTMLMFGSKVLIQYFYSNGIAFVVGAFPIRGPLSDADSIDTVWRIGTAVIFVSFYLVSTALFVFNTTKTSQWMAGGCLTASAVMYRFFGDLGNSRKYQPATFGHIQTLVDAIDDWSPVMYWGQKIGGEVCHAGTSPHPLRSLQPKSVYM
ncbi:hypothetical protein K438DRAFT_2020750 [Mycena galopus ATCC 62051]|nr:hypothetical protein K438DRAFT_2020750 [Mycena galopus ATCC 62051]